MLPSCSASFNLPSLPCIFPPSISEMLLNPLPIFLRSMFRRSFSLGQSTSTWTTVSFAPHSHLSLSWRPYRLPCVASHEWPVRSCVSMYARLRGSDPYIRRVRIEGRVASIWRRCPPFLDALHSCPHSSRILRRMYPFSRDRRCWKGCSLSGPTASLARRSAVSFPGSSQWPGTHWRRRGIPRVFNSLADWRMAWMMRLPRLIP